MIKQINKLLKLVGFNLVRAKRKSVKWQKLPPYTPEEVQNAPLKCAVYQPGTVPLSDYMGDAEWHSAPAPVGCEDHKITRTENESEWKAVLNPGNDGRTHYVGDDCPGGHRDLEQPRVEQPNSDNKIGGPTS